MLTHFQNNFTELALDLNEYPWLRGTEPVLTIVAPQYVYNMSTARREAVIKDNIKLMVFESTNNKFVVQIAASRCKDEMYRQAVIANLMQWAEDLNNPKSCIVDPATGYYPTVKSEYKDSDWI